MNNLCVYCELENGKIANVSRELFTKGRKLSSELKCQLEVIVIGTDLDGIENKIFPYGVDIIHIFDAKNLAPYTTGPHATILSKLFLKEKPQIVLFGATIIGRDLGPRVSSTLGSGLTADCTQLEIGEYLDKKNEKTYNNLLYQIRPAFGGNIIATIINPDNRPQMATVREGVMKDEIFDINYKGTLIRHNVSDFLNDLDFAVKVIDRHIEQSKHHLDSANIIVSGGYGVGSKEGFDKLFELAEVLHAEVGASRAAIDAGFCDHSRQVGQTGLTVRPKLYIACGISGQIQHISGMKESNIIISINTDPNAPINSIADYIITGKVEDVVPKIISKYKGLTK